MSIDFDEVNKPQVITWDQYCKDDGADWRKYPDAKFVTDDPEAKEVLTDLCNARLAHDPADGPLLFRSSWGKLFESDASDYSFAQIAAEVCGLEHAVVNTTPWFVLDAEGMKWALLRCGGQMT